MAVTSSTSTDVTAALSTASSSTSASSAANIKDQFLSLLVAQLNNQDPLNPMDNAELTSQLAQISTVESLENLNSSVNTALTSLQSQVAQGQALQSSSMIDKEVLVPGSRVLVGTSADGATREVTPLGVDFASAVSSATVKITDSAGNVVRTLDLGGHDVGVANVNWDGLNDAGVAVGDGSYTAVVAATNSTGAAVSDATMLTYGKVSAVAYTATGVQLNLGTAGAVGLGDVYQVF